MNERGQQPGGKPAGKGTPAERPMRPSSGRPAAGRARSEAPSRGREAPSRGRAATGGGTSGRGRAAAPDARRAELDARVYDPRREERRTAARVPLPDDVDPRMLDAAVRTELRSLSKDTADLVARHLVVVGQLIDDDPAQALQHARAARALAGRVGAVREAAGLAAYAAGEWADALAELRAARRISGGGEQLAVMADCERALGRPEKALAYADDAAVATLGQVERVELIIVLSGARRDLGQADAAVLQLQEPARRTRPGRPWAARLWYAYADALLAAGRPDEAREWFAAAADADTEGQTDADERLLELDGVVFEDLQDDGPDADERASDGDPAPAAHDHRPAG